MEVQSKLATNICTCHAYVIATRSLRLRTPLVARKINYYDMRKLKMTDTTKILNLITDDLSLLDGGLGNIALLLHTVEP